MAHLQQVPITTEGSWALPYGTQVSCGDMSADSNLRDSVWGEGSQGRFRVPKNKPAGSSTRRKSLRECMFTRVYEEGDRLLSRSGRFFFFFF